MKLILAMLIVSLVVLFLKYQETLIGHLDANNFDVESKVPDCLTLSYATESLSLCGNNVDQIRAIHAEYATAIERATLVSDYTNDYFTEKRDPLHMFCITRRVNASHLKSCVYVPGNNDYFYNKKLANQLYDKGYNFYAVSFPNFGFASTTAADNFSTFASIPGMYKYIDFLVEFYELPQIDILIGHSAGGLISTCYAAYKNKTRISVKRLVLSSPLFDWYSDAHTKSYFRSDHFLRQVITPVGLVVRKVNLKNSIGTPNLTTCEEFNEVNFNPKYKSLIEIHTYPEWIRACTLMMHRIQSGSVNVNCPVDVLVSDKSVYWEYTKEADNTLDIAAIMQYSNKIGSDVRMHVIPNSVHNTFLRVSDITAFLAM